MICLLGSSPSVSLSSIADFFFAAAFRFAAAFAPACSRCSGGNPCNQSGTPRKLDYCSSDATCNGNANIINIHIGHTLHSPWCVEKKNVHGSLQEKACSSCRARHSLFNWTPACNISPCQNNPVQPARTQVKVSISSATAPKR